MMLYVFHVDVGRMMSFDMTVALSSVENLKATIERLHNIPAANIVLLVSGGEMLTESTQVSCYSAGTDTNPIYMFLTGEVRLPSTMLQTDFDIDLRDQVERSIELPAVYDTVITRAQLASKMYEYARDEERFGERLVHDQHLQQQGWSAAVANLEDLTREFHSRYRNFCIFFDSHLQRRGVYLELLHNFNADLNKLSRIPILPGLMPLAEADFHGFDEFLDNDDVFSRSNTQQESVLMAGAKSSTSETSEQPSTSPHKKAKIGEHDADNTEQTPTSTNSSKAAAASSENSTTSGAMRRNTLNLLQWITSKENHNALQIMCQECVQGLSAFNVNIYEILKSGIENIIKVADQSEVKEIKGLGDRLMKLEEIKYKLKSMVQDQKELSTAFQQNQTRAIHLRDASILPDLCASHRSQLLVMLQNHKKIVEFRRLISKSKDELGSNLHMRLCSIVRIESAMSDYDSRLLFNHRCLKRAERHISIIEQIHQAPCIYVAAVTEVVRRKIFSEEFRTWASKLCEDFDSIHSEEIKRREAFNASFDGHFLTILFPGMNDMPPAFANETPLTFDGRLPNLTKSDIDMLSAYLPDLATQINLPDMQPVIRFFVSRSGEHQKARWEQLLEAEAMDSTSTSNLALIEKPQNQRLSELQKATSSSRMSGCDESETDTEIEFEKVLPLTDANSKNTPETSHGPNNIEIQVKPSTLDRSTITEQLTFVKHAETLTDENESATYQELQRVRESLQMLSQHSLECIRMARANLVSVRTDAEAYREDLQSDIQSLQETCKMLLLQSEAREKKAFENAELKQQEVTGLHFQINNRDLEIEQQKKELQKLEQLQIKCFSLEEKLAQMRDEADKEKETAVALAREDLIHEHKTEIESLRCRFKLMTSMERSPSDMSLEKIERPTSRSAAIAAHDEHQPPIQETLDMQQIEETLKAQFEAEKEKAIIAAVEAERTQWQSRLMLNSESVIANVGMLKVIEEKERQLEQLREREFMLTKENFQLKTRLDTLTNEDANSWLKEKIEYLNRDKERLEKELEKNKRLEMEGSCAGLRGPPTEHLPPRSKSSSSSHKCVVLQSLEKGDVVFVIWSTTYGQYIVVQDSQSLFFVHGDSLAGLRLRFPKRESESAGATGGVSAADDLPMPHPYHAIGVVIDKEYCQARKEKNRYRVPCGSKFYRVKLAPIQIVQPIARVPRDRLESFSKSVSHSQSQCESHSDASLTTLTADLEASVMQTDLTTSTAVTLGSPVTDTVDSTMSGVASGGAVAVSTTITASNNKNIEDEVTLLTERYRYPSVSEEDELSVTSTTNTNTAPQKQSVITEQPTASNKLKLDLRLTHDAAQSANVSAAAYQTKTHRPERQIDSPAMPIVMEPEGCAVTIGTTTNEDSDEYRSLEGKEDEAEFGTFD